jgi:hypothetical protein
MNVAAPTLVPPGSCSYRPVLLSEHEKRGAGQQKGVGGYQEAISVVTL